jgi:hypothetical protein
MIIFRKLITNDDVNEVGKPIAFIANASSSNSSSSKIKIQTIRTTIENFYLLCC